MPDVEKVADFNTLEISVSVNEPDERAHATG